MCMQLTDAAERLAGKRALVTGAASGIGLACARRMAAAGARVVRRDVSEEAAWREAGDALPATLGGLDILVNNAGIGIGGDITQLSLDDWRRQQAINLDGTFL